MHTESMAIINRLYFVEEVSENHYTFRYGGHVFSLRLHQKGWTSKVFWNMEEQRAIRLYEK